MSSGPVTPYVDFGTNPNDSNENNAAAIQPIANGEGVNATVLTRPDENLRQRTEAIRSRQVDSLYLENADRGLVIAGPGLLSWPGSTTAASTGIPTVSGPLYLLPMLTPGFAQTSPIPPVASAFGVIHLKRVTGSSNAIAVTSQRRSYAAGDQINITVTSGGAYSCTLDTEVTGALQRTIKIVATGSTTLGTVITSLNALTPPAPDNTALVSAALEGGASSGDLILATQARQFMTGNYDGEGHTITAANLASFFASNPTQALAEGDTLCISYADLYDTASTGGRRQSIPENSNTAVPAGSFFNSRVHPENLFNALPVCKVLNGYLVFGTGCAVAPGATNFDLTGSGASTVVYAGGGNWADGTTNPATTVENQLDKIISDLAGATGTAKIEGSAVGTYLGAATLASQISTIANFVHDDRPPTEASLVPVRAFRDWQGNARSLIDHRGQRMGAVSELDENWTLQPTTVTYPLSAALPSEATAAVKWVHFNSLYWKFTQTGASTNDILAFSLGGIVPVGAIITNINIKYKRDTAGDNIDFSYGYGTGLTGVLACGFNSASGTGTVTTDLGAAPTSGFLPRLFDGSSEDAFVWISPNTLATTFEVFSVKVTYIQPPRGWTYTLGTMNNLTATVPSDSVSFLDPDVNINHRSVKLVSASANTFAGSTVIQGPPEVWLNTDVAYAMEFIIRTGTITDAAHAAAYAAGIASASPVQGITIAANSTGNWQLSTLASLSVNLTDSGVAIAANTTYRVRIEVYGINRNSTTKTRAVLYINGTKVAEDATRTYTDTMWYPYASVGTTVGSAAGPYDFRVGRVRRTWNHLPSSDLL